MTEKKTKRAEKAPLDMTTDEAMAFLFGKEGAEKLKEAAREITSPRAAKEPLNASAKSS